MLFDEDSASISALRLLLGCIAILKMSISHTRAHFTYERACRTFARLHTAAVQMNVHYLQNPFDQLVLAR